jgi:DNA-binding CsgD family transcriptional regulator
VTTETASYWIHLRRYPLCATLHQAGCPSCRHRQGGPASPDPEVWFPCATLEGGQEPLRLAKSKVFMPTPCRRCFRDAGGPAPSPTAHRDLSSLTGREEEVAALLALGRTDQQIALAMGLGAGTVRGHVRHIRSKHGLRSRTETVVWARLRTEVEQVPRRGPR